MKRMDYCTCPAVKPAVFTTRASVLDMSVADRWPATATLLALDSSDRPYFLS